MHIVYSEQDNLYYCKFRFYSKKKVGGIYCWEDLSQTPTLITSEEDSSMFNRGRGNCYMKKVDGNIYFLLEKSLYLIKNKSVEKIVATKKEIFTSTGFIGVVQPSDSVLVTSINEHLVITIPNANFGMYKDEDIYKLENYTATGDETDTVTVTF